MPKDDTQIRVSRALIQQVKDDEPLFEKLDGPQIAEMALIHFDQLLKGNKNAFTLRDKILAAEKSGKLTVKDRLTALETLEKLQQIEQQIAER